MELIRDLGQCLENLLGKLNNAWMKHFIPFDRGRGGAHCWKEEIETSQPVPPVTSLGGFPFKQSVSSRVFPPPCVTAWADARVRTEKGRPPFKLAVPKPIRRWDLGRSRGSIQKLSNPSTKLEKISHKQEDSGDGLHLHPLPTNPPSFFSIPATSHIQRTVRYTCLYISEHAWVRAHPLGMHVTAASAAHVRRPTRRCNFLSLLLMQIELIDSVIMLWKIKRKALVWITHIWITYFIDFWKGFTTRSANYFAKWTIISICNI